MNPPHKKAERFCPPCSLEPTGTQKRHPAGNGCRSNNRGRRVPLSLPVGVNSLFAKTDLRDRVHIFRSFCVNAILFGH